MKKTILIIVSVLIVIVLAVLCFKFLMQDSAKSANDVFKISNETQVKEYIEKENVKTYSFDGDMAYLGQIKLFGTDSDIEFYMTDGYVDEIDAVFTIFRFDDGVVIEDDTESETSDIYTFTEEDKKKIEDSFANIKKGFEQYVGCSFETYDIRPTHDVENLKDTEENFYAGDFVKEYSVRDNNNVLWIMRYEASFGSSSVVIQKVVNESGYEGFIPAIDMTKE